MLNDLGFIGNAIMVIAGLVIVLAAMVVLHSSDAVEISPRTIGAMLVGFSGAWCITKGLTLPPPHSADLLLPCGIAVWVIGSIWRRRNKPIRRSSDFTAHLTHHH